MGIGTGAAIIGGIAAPIAGAAISGNAATTAAGDQSSTALQVAQMQQQASDKALGFQEQQYNTGQAEAQPWLQSGTGALSNLDYLLGVTPQTASGQTAQPVAGAGAPNRGVQPGAVQSPGGLQGAQNTLQPFTPAVGGSSQLGTQGGAPSANSGAAQTPFSAAGSSAQGGYGSLNAPYPGGQFTAPTAAQALQSPGEQAQLQLGQQALEQSAAARGGLLTGGVLQGEQQYAQNLASTNYQNVYNNAYNTYSSNYNQDQQQKANEYNRLASLAGVGQQTAGQLGTLGQNSANSITSNLLGSAQAQGQQLNNSAAANASGIVGSANAYGGAISSAGSGLTNLALLSQLGLGGSGDGSSAYNLVNTTTGNYNDFMVS